MVLVVKGTSNVPQNDFRTSQSPFCRLYCKNLQPKPGAALPAKDQLLEGHPYIRACCVGSLKRVSKSVQVLFNGVGAAMVLYFRILKWRALHIELESSFPGSCFEAAVGSKWFANPPAAPRVH